MISAILFSALALAAPPNLLWPVNCVPGSTCEEKLGFADPMNTGKTHDCRKPGYPGHEGTDIVLKPASRMDQGVDVYAAADGKVLWVFYGHFDHCPNDKEPDCAEPKSALKPGVQDGYDVCTPLGPFCRDGAGECFWCFAGANVVVLKHEGLDGVFATRYDHLRKNSVRVKPGDAVKAGQVIAQAGSAGHSSAPHLHFEVWGNTYYDPVDPWPGDCNPRVKTSLWKLPGDPWKALVAPR